MPVNTFESILIFMNFSEWVDQIFPNSIPYQFFLQEPAALLVRKDCISQGKHAKAKYEIVLFSS